MDDNSNSAKYTGKYDNQIKLRKAKLEQMRKERQILQYDKLMRELSAQESLEENRLKIETREKAKEINDLEIDKIQQELNKLKESPKSDQQPQELIKTNLDDKKISLSDKLLKLKCCNLPITEIPPVDIATYSKATQTDMSRLYRNNNLSLKKVYEDHDREYQNDSSPLKLMCKFSSNLPPGILSPGLPIVMDMPPALTPLDKENPWNYLKEKNKKLIEEKAEEMMLSEDFLKSLKSLSLAMEKVVRKNKNIYVDYIDGANNDWDYDNNSKGPLSLNQMFYDKNLNEKRCITCIDWSSYNAEQIAASYYKNEHDTVASNAGGDVIIWNRNSETPEHIFYCHSSVMSICFTKFNPNLIIGATYSGQIVLWDNRVKTNIPVQCTQLNSKAHSQPIYCLRVIDNEDSSHNIISISSDGKMCSWSLDMLGYPLDIIQLQLDVSEKVKKPIGVNCIDFPANGINNMVMGAEDGCVYSAFRFGYDAGITNSYEKHEAPITSISTHYNQATTPPNFGNLFLTSSLDCTIKLWSLESAQPLHTFKNNFDYVMDIAWSPIHPALFAAGNGGGRLDFYNLNEDIQEPIKSITTRGESAINRLKWHNDGQHIAVGTDNGELCIYNIAEDLANPVNDEWSTFSNTLYDIRVNCAIEGCE